MAREQKAILKLLDKDGHIVDFHRFANKNTKRILEQFSELCKELSLEKDNLKKADKLVIYETDSYGHELGTLYECDRSEILNMVKEAYKKYHGYYPEEDKWDSERWNYITSSKKSIKSEYEDLEAALKEIEEAIDNAGDYDDVEEMEMERQEILKKLGRNEAVKSSRNARSVNTVFNAREPIVSRITQRKLKEMAEYGEATDITRWETEDIRNLGHLETLDVSRGTYGMNGALFQDDAGNLYVITARNSNLFMLV